MSDDKIKSELNLLREQRNEQVGKARQYLKEQTQIRKKIKEVWGLEELTIPEIADKTNIASESVLWHVMAMRKFGYVQETGMKGDYPTYKLLEKG